MCCAARKTYVVHGYPILQISTFAAVAGRFKTVGMAAIGHTRTVKSSAMSHRNPKSSLLVKDFHHWFFVEGAIGKLLFLGRHIILLALLFSR